ncbi:MAG: hypothetical protein AAF572_21890 [Cyanobacteria bacterium P01_B01_bin.77]
MKRIPVRKQYYNCPADLSDALPGFQPHTPGLLRCIKDDGIVCSCGRHMHISDRAGMHHEPDLPDNVFYIEVDDTDKTPPQIKAEAKAKLKEIAPDFFFCNICGDAYYRQEDTPLEFETCPDCGWQDTPLDLDGNPSTTVGDWVTPKGSTSDDISPLETAYLNQQTPETAQQYPEHQRRRPAKRIAIGVATSLFIGSGCVGIGDLVRNGTQRVPHAVYINQVTKTVTRPIAEYQWSSTREAWLDEVDLTDDDIYEVRRWDEVRSITEYVEVPDPEQEIEPASPSPAPQPVEEEVPQPVEEEVPEECESVGSGLSLCLGSVIEYVAGSPAYAATEAVTTQVWDVRVQYKQRRLVTVGQDVQQVIGTDRLPEPDYSKLLPDQVYKRASTTCTASWEVWDDAVDDWVPRPAEEISCDGLYSHIAGAEGYYAQIDISKWGNKKFISLANDPQQLPMYTGVPVE